MSAAQRAVAWHHAAQAAVCDVLEPWEHGTIVRATRYPSYFDYNLVRVERDPRAGVAELAAVADAALAGLGHRRIDFDDAAVAEPLRAGFEAQGWHAVRLVWMRHEGPVPGAGALAVEEVPYDEVADLRVAWHREDFPDLDPAGYHQEAREVALRRGARVLTVREGGVPVAFAQLERDGSAAEITQVYVHPDHRGGGRGTVMYRVLLPQKPSVVSPVVVVGTAVRVRTRVKVHRGEHRGRVRFRGRITPAAPGSQILIQKHRHGQWETIAHTFARDSGPSFSRYSKRVRQRHGGRYRVVADVQGAHVGGVGRTVRVHHVRR